MKHIEVRIMGQNYVLGCPEGGEAPLRAAVERVDAAMCKIRDSGKVKARDRIAVLASLNLAFDLEQLEAAAQASASRSIDRADESASIKAEDPRVTKLLQRLDQALAKDDHLL